MKAPRFSGETTRRALALGAAAGAFAASAFASSPTQLLRLTEIGPLIVPGNPDARGGSLEEAGVISPDGRLIALRLGDTMSLWDAATRERIDFDIALPPAPAGLVFNTHRAAAFSADAHCLALASRNTLGLIDLQTFEPMWSRTYEDDEVWQPRTLSFRPGHHTIAVTGEGSSTALIDARNGAVRRCLRHPQSRLIATHVFTADGSRLITGPDDGGVIAVRNGETGALMRERAAPRGAWLGLARDQRHLVSAGHWDTIVVWSFPDLEVVRAFDPGLPSPAFGQAAAAYLRCAFAGPEDAWLIVARGETRGVKVFDWRTGEVLLETAVEGSSGPPLAVFPDGETLLFGDPARLWSLTR